MKRLDRAVYAIFLLALLADVARAHSSAPVGGDAGLILSAASQLQVNPAGDAILVLRRADGSPSQIARFERFRWNLAGWSRDFSDFSSVAMLAVPGSALDDGARSFSLALSTSAPPSPAVFEHTGSPAP
jgi:hypothetical protein